MTHQEMQELKEEQDRQIKVDELKKEIELSESPLYKATKRGYDNVKTREVGETFRFAGQPGEWMTLVKPGKNGEPLESKDLGGHILAAKKGTDVRSVAQDQAQFAKDVKASAKDVL